VPLLCRPLDLWSSCLAPQPRQGCATQNSHPSDSHDFLQTVPQMPAKLAIHRHPQPPLCRPLPLSLEQAYTISALQGWAPKTCQAGDPQTFKFSTRQRPSDLHRPAQSPLGSAPKACQACDPQTFTISTGQHSLGLHRLAPAGLRPSGLPGWRFTGTHDLHSTRSMASRNTRPMLQKPARSPQWQVSNPSPVGPTHLPPTTGGLQIYLGNTDRSRY
jgi:hypothetical protein